MGSELDLLAGFAPLLELRNGGEQRVGRGIDGGLNGVLNDADDEADADDLHGNIVGDAEQGAGHGDEQQRAARNAGRAARAERRHDRQDDRDGQLHGDAERVHRGERHDGDRDGRACHVDGRAEGDGHGVELLIQAEALAQGHVYGDVRGGGAGEERGHAALLQALEHQRIGVLADDDERHDGVDDEGGKEHAADEDEQELAVLGKDGKAAGGHGGEHETQDTERGEVDDEAHCLGDGVGGVGEELLGRVGRALEREAEHDSPEQNAEIVGRDDRADGVGDNVVEQAGENGGEALRRTVGGGLGQRDGHGEQVACDDGDDGREERGHEVEHDDGAELLAQLLFGLSQGADDEDKDQQRGDGLQRADEQGAEDADAGRGHSGIGDQQGERRTDDHADDDAQHEADAIVRFDKFHSFFFLFAVCFARKGAKGSLTRYERNVNREAIRKNDIWLSGGQIARSIFVQRAQKMTADTMSCACRCAILRIC